MTDDPRKPPPDEATMRLAATPSNEQMANAWKSAEPTDRHVGQVMGGYEVVRRLAEGGMGVIYEGRHAKLGRRVAIKVLKPEYCQSEDVVERFYQEARAVNEIHHENIVDVYDFGREPDGRVFFIMEFLEGESLGARLHRGTVYFAEALPILEQVVRALKAAHEKGFVHRDLKPDNIWLKHRDDGGVEVKLLDFGIAKLTGTEGAKDKLTRTGAIIGTPTYMSPEQINGGPAIDGRTDIYSLGIIIYELFMGSTPFQGEALAAIMMGHLFNEPPPMNVHPALGVPEGAQQIVTRMLAKNPDERYATVSDVLSDLRSVAQNREPTVVSKLDRERPRSVATGAPRTEPSMVTSPVVQAPAGRSKLVVPLVALGVIGAVVGGYVLLNGKKAAPPTAPVAASGQPSTPTEPTPGPGSAQEPATPSTPTVDLEKAGRDARVVLRDSLAHTEPKVRVQGTDGVAAVKDGESEPRLLELVATDPDAEVRGHAAAALGVLGATAAKKPLEAAERKAEPALRVWYAAALARLGDRDGRRHLIRYAKDDDLAVAFPAALALADVSEGGDKDAIGALVRLAAREAELNDVAPYAGAVLLGKLAALREERARNVLYQLLDDKNERSRLAAAEGLARLGDEAAVAPLKKTLDDAASPNRLVAAVALIPLGDYAGYDLLTEKLKDPDPERRRLAARGLGEIGETASVSALSGLLADPDHTVRVASAVALLFIVGLDPALLAQASVDWAKGALESQDWAVRAAGAGVLGDMVEEDAVPLLAQAFVDDDKNVRRAAARSARKMKTPAAAKAIAEAVVAERDKDVKADQVRALGAIGDAAGKPALEQLAKDPDTLGVLASGALIAVGDPGAATRLAAAMTDRHTEMREAAVEASIMAKHPVVVPTLAVGAGDRVFTIRFAAAEGLAGYQAEKAVAQPVLEEGLAQRDLSFQARARAALLALGVSPTGGVTPDELLGSPDPAVRLGAAHEIARLPWIEARPLVRRMLADPDVGVRRRGLDIVETGDATQRPDAIKLYKLVVDDLDEALRAKARARLGRIAAPTKLAAAPTAPVTPAITPPPAVDAAVPAVVDTKVSDAAVMMALAAKEDAAKAARELEAISTEVTAAIARPADDDRDIRKVKDLARSARTVRDRVKAASEKAADAAQAAEKAARATPSDEATQRAAQAKIVAEEVAELSKAAIATSETLDKQADEYASSETGDVEMLVAGADTAIASGKLSDAKRDLDKAAAQAAASGESYPAIKWSYGRLYESMAKREKDVADKVRLLKKAKQGYDDFARSGSGSKVARAKERSAELAEEITELEGATP
ncbi:MAG TPA: HEAT repeat domain-containing protein [Kofleriaceae bacterium]|nr:HEAT repeat domain-containing protein [Kofleriaceae bacterium]